ncbi:MAG: phosphocholine cytidylyltransferase family protein [Gammaproteobacteria bacterium]|nr:phosphocholine cytidylyltransferase family protein [Gammaproteobacteria bacterium]
MKAIILAAGRGSRMGNLTERQPKCFTELHGKRLIDWQLSALEGENIKQISIVVGYRAENFDLDLRYFRNDRWQETNMVVSLLAADDWLDSDTCLVSYSDIVYSKDTVEKLAHSNGDIAVAYDPNWRKLWEMRFKNPLDDAETFRLSDYKIVEIGNRSSSIEEIEGQYIGLMKFTKEGWRKIRSYLSRYSQPEVDKMDVTSLLQRLIIDRHEIVGVPISQPWYEVDSESDLRMYSALEKLF